MNRDDIEAFTRQANRVADQLGHETFYWRNAENTMQISNHARLEDWLPVALSKVDPLSDDLVTMQSGRHSRRCLAVRLSRRVDTHENHFYFRTVYRVIDMPWIGYTQDQTLDGFLSNYRTKVNENMARTNVQWGPLQQLLDSGRRYGSANGNIYFVFEGGGPIDGSGINVRLIENTSDLQTANYNGNIAGTTSDRIGLSYGATCCLTDQVLPMNINRPHRYEGTMMIEPFGTKGYVYAEVVANSSSCVGRGWPQLDYESERELIEKVLRYRTESYPVYTGWIPNDLTDIVVSNSRFDLAKVGEEPNNLFGNDLADRLINRRLHLKGNVSLLYGGVKYPVSTGEYFMIPKSSLLKNLNMLEYDAEVRSIISEITLLSFSSRSLAITNRVGDQGDSPIVTSIKSRDLSGNTNGDSGFIPRPTKRRIN